MKHRNRQRENRRLKGASPSESSRLEKPWLNHEGYHDPTAYQALRNIERRDKGRHQAPVGIKPR